MKGKAPDLYNLVITVDNPTEANVLKAEQEVLEGIEVHVPVLEYVIDPETSEVRDIKIETLKLVNIDEIEPENPPTYQGHHYTLTEKIVEKGPSDEINKILRESIFGMVREFPVKAVIVQSPEDKHHHHSLLGYAGLLQRNFQTNVFTTPYEAFGQKDSKNPDFFDVDDRTAIENLAEIQVHSEIKWNESVPYEPIEKGIKKYIDLFSKMLQKAKGNWDIMIGKVAEFEGDDKKGYHSLSRGIRRRRGWTERYLGRKVKDNYGLKEELYRLGPVDHGLLSDREQRPAYIAMHPDDRPISLWSYRSF